MVSYSTYMHQVTPSELTPTKTRSRVVDVPENLHTLLKAKAARERVPLKKMVADKLWELVTPEIVSQEGLES